MSHSLYQHYRPEEQPFIDQVLGWLQQIDNQYVPHLSHFLTPREAMITQQLVQGYGDHGFKFWGGYPQAERQRALIYPAYYEVTAGDFQLAALNINYPVKFGEISHGKILGTLMSTGIDRSRTGDFITDGTHWHLIVDQSIASYLMQQVDKIANVGVRLEEMATEDLLEPVEEWETVTEVVRSLRLDTVLSTVYHISRQRAKRSIAEGLVKVNFVPVERPDLELGESDIISFRKHGRFVVISLDGLTRKDNLRLSINLLKG